MARQSCFLTILLISALLSLSFFQGYGRNVKVMGRHFPKDNTVEERMTTETVMDYEGPKANTNPRNGAYLFPPPAPPPAQFVLH